LVQAHIKDPSRGGAEHALASIGLDPHDPGLCGVLAAATNIRVLRRMLLLKLRDPGFKFVIQYGSVTAESVSKRCTIPFSFILIHSHPLYSFPSIPIRSHPLSSSWCVFVTVCVRVCLCVCALVLFISLHCPGWTRHPCGRSRF
jgi:hypothetical protein